MGLGRIDKLQLLTWTCTKPTQGGQCIIGAPLVLGRAMGNLDSQDSPRPRLGGSHHLPPYSILCGCPWGPHPNGFLSRDSQVGVSKLPKLGFPRLQCPITSRANFIFWIKMRFKEKLQPSSRAFQQRVARHLHATKSGRFPTFSGRESNCQFDFRPFFWP